MGAKSSSIQEQWLNEKMQDCFQQFQPFASTTELYCNATWDTFLCWPPTKAGETASLPCPPAKGVDSSKAARKRCSIDGHWQGRATSGPWVPHGWTNYSDCFTDVARQLLGKLYSTSEKEARQKLEIAQGTRIMEMVGLTVSLAALLLSLTIFFYFRSLKNYRTTIHRNLFVAILLQVLVRLVLYVDQNLTRQDTVSDVPKLILFHLPKGIDNTPILCEAFYVLLEYARTVMFMWMLIEGLHLHNMVAGAVFQEKPKYGVFFVFGWGAPVIMTSLWAAATSFFYRGVQCWWGYSFTSYFWILEGPRLTIIVTNFIFLMSIIRVLVIKLRETNSNEAQHIRKAARAALVLLPLLGITNVLTMIPAPLGGEAFVFAAWSYGTHFLTSFQGFFISVLYCFLNGEVRATIRKQWFVFMTKRTREQIRCVRASCFAHCDMCDLDPGDQALSTFRSQDVEVIDIIISSSIGGVSPTGDEPL